LKLIRTNKECFRQRVWRAVCSKRENIRTAVGSWEISVWSGWEAR